MPAEGPSWVDELEVGDELVVESEGVDYDATLVAIIDNDVKIHYVG